MLKKKSQFPPLSNHDAKSSFEVPGHVTANVTIGEA